MRADVTIAEWGPDAVVAGAGEFERIYARAFGAPGYDEPPEAAQRFRAKQLPTHAGRDGFRCVVALRGERMLGFAYGYTGGPRPGSTAAVGGICSSKGSTRPATCMDST